MSSDPQISEAIRMLQSLVPGGFLSVCTKGQNLAGKKENKSTTKKQAFYKPCSFYLGYVTKLELKQLNS